MTTTAVRGRPRTTGVGSFLLVTALLSWGPWGAALALGGDIADPPVWALYAVGGFGPTLAAGVMRLVEGPGERQVRWRSAAGWGPVALLLGAGPAVVAALVGPLLGGPPADLAAAGGTVARLGGVLPLLAVFLVAGPLAEEFGWRGYLQPRLRRTLSPARTALAVGMAWAVWHVPLFLLTGTGQAEIGLFTPVALGFFVAMVPLSVAYWFVSERLRGGVPAAVLTHLAGNLALTLLAVTTSAVGGVLYLITVVLLAGLLLLVARPRDVLTGAVGTGRAG